MLVKLLYCIHPDSSSFLIHIYFSTNTWFLRSLGSTHVRGSWNNPNAASALGVSPYWWKAEFDGMCLWAVCYSRAMSSPSYRKYRWCSHFNCWEATIWFTRRIDWISLRCLKACWWSYPRIRFRMWSGCKNSQPTREAALK